MPCYIFITGCFIHKKEMKPEKNKESMQLENIEDFRNFCLSFRGVHEKMPFGKATSEYDRNVLVFYVRDKWFCFVNIEEFDFCNIRCPQEQIPELLECYEGIRPGYHMNKKHWISVYFQTDVPDGKIRELVRQSYNSVVAKMSRKERELLAQEPPCTAADRTAAETGGSAGR